MLHRAETSSQPIGQGYSTPASIKVPNEEKKINHIVRCFKTSKLIESRNKGKTNQEGRKKNQEISESEKRST